MSGFRSIDLSGKCNECNGRGWFRQAMFDDGKYINCDRCKGSGCEPIVSWLKLEKRKEDGK